MNASYLFCRLNIEQRLSPKFTNSSAFVQQPFDWKVDRKLKCKKSCLDLLSIEELRRIRENIGFGSCEIFEMQDYIYDDYGLYQFDNAKQIPDLAVQVYQHLEENRTNRNLIDTRKEGNATGNESRQITCAVGPNKDSYSTTATDYTIEVLNCKLKSDNVKELQATNTHANQRITEVFARLNKSSLDRTFDENASVMNENRQKETKTVYSTDVLMASDTESESAVKTKAVDIRPHIRNFYNCGKEDKCTKGNYRHNWMRKTLTKYRTTTADIWLSSWTGKETKSQTQTMWPGGTYFIRHNFHSNDSTMLKATKSKEEGYRVRRTKAANDVYYSGLFNVPKVTSEGERCVYWMPGKQYEKTEMLMPWFFIYSFSEVRT